MLPSLDLVPSSALKITEVQVCQGWMALLYLRLLLRDVSVQQHTSPYTSKASLMCCQCLYQMMMFHIAMQDY